LRGRWADARGHNSQADIGFSSLVLQVEIDNTHTETDAAAVQQPEDLLLAAVMLLAETIDMRDPSTARHARLVGRFARETATVLGVSPEHVERIHAAGVLHDLGKIGIADAILHKPGPLTDREWVEVGRHPDIGAQILESAGMHDLASWVRQHHERIDAEGYPMGVGGANISLEARILAVADAYEAMIADRPYRDGLPSEAAREELLRCAGTQFDPVVVDAFLAAVGHEASASGRGTEVSDTCRRDARMRVVA
jgi:HD-GYP domain-containing protein (c-di-GMP phosphodiesterase class II)